MTRLYPFREHESYTGSFGSSGIAVFVIRVEGQVLRFFFFYKCPRYSVSILRAMGCARYDCLGRRTPPLWFHPKTLQSPPVFVDMLFAHNWYGNRIARFAAWSWIMEEKKIIIVIAIVQSKAPHSDIASSSAFRVVSYTKQMILWTSKYRKQWLNIELSSMELI